MKDLEAKATAVVRGLILTALLATGAAQAQPAGTAGERARERAETGETARTQVYGWELMTPEERLAYQARMRDARTAEERARIRAEHHVNMQERARQQGVTLPDMPMHRGPGRGDGQGKGPDTRQRAGSGKGKGWGD